MSQDGTSALAIDTIQDMGGGKVFDPSKVAMVSGKLFRNAINTGLPVVECDTDAIGEGDELSIDLEAGVLRNITKGAETAFPPLPPVMATLLADGSLAAHFKKHGGFAF